MQLCVAGCLPHLTAVMTPAGATSGDTSTCIDELSRLKIIAVIIVIPADNENQCLSSTACAAIVAAQTVLETVSGLSCRWRDATGQNDDDKHHKPLIHIRAEG
jgi:threonine synthase